MFYPRKGNHNFQSKELQFIIETGADRLASALCYGGDSSQGRSNLGRVTYIYIYISPSRDNGKENGNYYVIVGYMLGLYWGDGKENGSYYLGFRV